MDESILPMHPTRSFMVRRITQIDVLDGKVDPPEGYKIPERISSTNGSMDRKRIECRRNADSCHERIRHFTSQPFIISHVIVANSTISRWLAPHIWPLFCPKMNFAHLTLKPGTYIDMDHLFP